MSSSLPPTSTLPHLPTEDLTKVLDLLFEPSPTLHSLSLPVIRSAPFPDYPTLITAVRAQLLALANANTPEYDERLQAILGAHPRLGAKKVNSELSKQEQAQLQGGKEEESKMLEELNREYEEKFPGLRYVVFVNGRPRPEIMENMRARIDRGDAKAERLEAIQAMCDIAIDRASKLHKE